MPRVRPGLSGVLRRGRTIAPPQDPAVVEVEGLLLDGAARIDLGGVRRLGITVSHALWICACITVDDSPTWLLCDTADGGATWGRVSDGVEPLDLVNAQLLAGGHADPADVRHWLRGELAEPWGTLGSGRDPSGVAEHLRSRIRGRGTSNHLSL